VSEGGVARLSPVTARQPGDPEKIGPYAILGRLGAGGMGTVYLARFVHAGPGAPLVAVKVVHGELSRDPEFRARFRDEVAAAQRVAPFCTARLLDADPNATPPYLVTEYVDGLPLGRVVADRGELDSSTLHGVALGVAAALTAIHGAGLVHRDLKPANVLLSLSGPRVIDFGIARATNAAAGLTMAGTVLGTPGWMAPEQFSSGAVGTAADVFSWGSLVAFAATGRPPWGDEGPPASFAYRIIHAEPDVTGLSGTLRTLVLAALRKTPTDRPTARDLVLALLGASPDHPGGAPRSAIENPTAAATAAATQLLASSTMLPRARGGLPIVPPRTPVPGTPAVAASGAAGGMAARGLAGGGAAGGGAGGVAARGLAGGGAAGGVAARGLAGGGAAGSGGGGVAARGGAAGSGAGGLAAPGLAAAGSARPPAPPTPRPAAGKLGSLRPRTPAPGTPVPPPGKLPPTRALTRPVPDPRGPASRLSGAAGRLPGGVGRVPRSGSPGTGPTAGHPPGWQPPRHPPGGYAPVPRLRVRKWYRKKRYMIGLGLLALILIAAALRDDSGAAGHRSGSASTNSGRGPTVAGKPAVAPAEGLNVPVRDGKLEFTVRSWQCGVPKLGTGRLKRSASGQFCLADVQARNIGNATRTLAEWYEKVVDADGAAHAADLGARFFLPKQTLWNAVGPGGTVRGTIAFDIPTGARPSHLELHDGPVSGGVEVPLPSG
jgi:Protein kinase domain/Domain of unknown function (DUF4352)